MSDEAVKEAVDSTADEQTADKTADAPADKGAQAPADKGAGKVAADKSATDKGDKPKATSVLDDVGEDGEEDTKKVLAPADWPEDWREKAVADITDEKAKTKELKRLQRMKSPADIYKSYRAIESKLKDEYVRRPPDDDATDEQKAEWRKAVGVPEKPEEYKVPEIKGHEWVEADQPIIQEYLTHMHKADAPQAQVDAGLQWYAAFKQASEERIFNTDQEDKQGIEDALRAEWGPEYRGTVNLMGRYLKDSELFPEGFIQKLDRARFDDGHRVINDPVVAKWLAGLAKEKYGDGAVVSGDAMAKSSSRKKEIEETMAKDIDEYYKQGLDKEYAEILKREEGRGGKRAA